MAPAPYHTNGMMMSPMNNYNNYGAGSYSSNSYKQRNQFVNLGFVSTTSLSICVAVCDVNGNCNSVSFTSMTCILFGGLGLSTVQTNAGTGMCARILRPGQNLLINSNQNNYQQQQPANNYYH